MEAPMVSERTREMESRQRQYERVETESRTGVVERGRYLAIAVAHDGIAPSSNGHGRPKFRELVDVLLQSEAIHATLCFYTEGVHWVTRESPVLGELQEILS